MEEPNVNRLNGIANFGHGFSDPEQVDKLSNLPEETMSEDIHYEEGKENVSGTERTEEKDNG